MRIRYEPISSELFIRNRKKFVSKLPRNAMAIFFSNDLMPRSGDQNYPFRQNPDLFYLTGIDQEETALVIYPDCPLPKFREALFLRKTNDLIATWEGHKYTKDQARTTSGMENIYWMDTFDLSVHTMIGQASEVFINNNENDRFQSEINYKDLRFAEELKKKIPGLTLGRSGPIMKELRSIKDDLEVGLIRKACEITRDAFVRILKFIKPGVMEYEIEAEIIHEFLRQGSNGHAYEPIIASGADSCILHYIDNNKRCKDGEILLMDFGADYANYAADLTRSVPVNGRYTDRQKAVYNACLRVMKQGRELLASGNSIEEIGKEAGKLMESELLGLGLIDKADIQKQDKDNPAYRKYFMHGLGHFLGLDVHDIGDRYDKITEGMVFTCEPGIYIREEGLGIRIENDILITHDGFRDLMHDIPVEVEEIEEIMNSH